jgi:hypothetical protein
MDEGDRRASAESIVGPAGYSPKTGPTSAAARTLPLPGNRRRVLAELRLISPDAAEIYEGALWILEEPANPQRARFAAAAMRELIVELGKSAGVEHQRGLKDRVIGLRETWRRVKRTGEQGIEGSTVTIALRIDRFFEEVELEHPTKRTGMSRTARGLDAIGGPLSEEADKERATTLMDFDKRFNIALHGGTSIGVSECETQIEAFGDFILSLRRPPVAAAMRSIDDLFRKGPPRG